jgi:hypothetical protein
LLAYCLLLVAYCSFYQPADHQLDRRGDRRGAVGLKYTALAASLRACAKDFCTGCGKTFVEKPPINIGGTLQSLRKVLVCASPPKGFASWFGKWAIERRGMPHEIARATAFMLGIRFSIGTMRLKAKSGSFLR